MHRVPRVRQHDASDCGVACLASIARAHGRRVSLARLRQHAGTDRGGTTVLGLVRAAEGLGFLAKGVRGTPETLPRAPMPTIAHVTREQGDQHFVVIERATREHVWLMDPAGGDRRTVPRPEFDARWSGVLVLLAPSASAGGGEEGSAGAASSADAVSAGARLWRLVRPHRGALAEALTGALVYTVLGLATSLYVQQLVDGVLADGRAGALRAMTLAMVLIVVAQTLIGTLRALLMTHVGQHIDAGLILGYYRHLVRLPQAFFDRHRVGDLTSRITDAVKIRAFVGEVAVEAVASALVVGASATMMFLYDWRLALWTLGSLPVYAALYAVGARLNRRQQRLLMEGAAAMEAQVVESLGMIGTVKRLGLEAQVESLTEARFVRLFRAIAVSVRTTVWLSNGAGLVGRLSVIGLLYLGSTRALAQQLTAGQLMSCYALLGFLTGPALTLVGFSRAVQEARSAGARLFEIMELDAERAGEGLPMSAAEVGEGVRLEGVSFRYGNRAWALREVSFTCRRGEVTALVGESGSGKSTVAALLQRLHPVEGGRILIGARDVAHVELSSLRRLVGVVPQTVELFAGSVLENVVPGETAPDVALLTRLCHESGASGMIEALPQGWLTQVGERGAALSGGERQRLAVVRALYRRPAVLVVDEGTSALDAASEEQVLELLRRAAAAGAVVILIAHRLSAVRSADHIVVLAAGRVVEEGEHQLLVDTGGVYARLWACQHPDDGARVDERREARDGVRREGGAGQTVPRAGRVSYV